jgi:hypothetical protein
MRLFPTSSPDIDTVRKTFRRTQFGTLPLEFVLCEMQDAGRQRIFLKYPSSFGKRGAVDYDVERKVTY